MRLIITFLIVAAAVINIVIGIGFFVNPLTTGADFGVLAEGVRGESALRADFSAFFLVAAIFMIWGAWQRRGDLFLAPIALFGIAFAGRALNLILHGGYEGWWMPMLVEAGHVIVLSYARYVLPHHTVQETGDA